MSAEVTQLALGVDSSQVKTAETALDKMAAAGGRAEGASSRLEKAFAAVQTETQGINAGIARLVALHESQGRAVEGARGATERLSKAQKEQGKSAAQAAMQNLQLSNQIQDFFVQVAAGGNPLTAAVQQGSQLTAVYGGFGAALEGVRSVFTAARLAALGLGAGIAYVAYQAYQGAQQSRNLQRSLILTGNAAGLTEGSFNSMAAGIARSTRSLVSDSRDTLQQLVNTGRFSGDTLRLAGEAAQGLSKATGQSTDEIVKSFVNLAGGVGKGAESLNQQYNFLTAAQISQIKTLEDQGNAQQALAVTFGALSTRTKEVAEDTGLLATRWREVKAAIDGAVEAARSVGRDKTVEDQLAPLMRDLADAQRRIGNGVGGNPIEQFFIDRAKEEAAALQLQIDKLNAKKAAQDRVAQGQADDAARTRAQVQFGNELEGTLSRQIRLEREQDRIRKLGASAGASIADVNKLLAAAAERIDPSSQSSLSARISATQRQLQLFLAATSAGEAELEANRAAGLVSERDYYDQKRAFIEANTRSEIAQLQAQNAALADYARERGDLLSKDQKAANQQQIAGNLNRISELTIKAASATAVLTTQQTAATTQLARQYESLTMAASSYLETLARQQARELDGIGIGAEERQRLQARARIEDEFRSKREDLEKRARQGAFAQNSEAYDRELALINDTQTQALRSYDRYYGALQDKQGDALSGLTEAVRNYATEAKNVSKTTEGFFTSSFKSIEDALARFVVGQKVSFRDLVQSILAESIKLNTIRPLLAQAFEFLPSLFGVSGASLGGAGPYEVATGARAIGGPVSAGGVYRVLEKGAPEVATFNGRSYLMTGAQSGTVTPAAAAAPAPTYQVIVQGDASAATLRLINNALAQFEARRMRALA